MKTRLAGLLFLGMLWLLPLATLAQPTPSPSGFPTDAPLEPTESPSPSPASVASPTPAPPPPTPALDPATIPDTEVTRLVQSLLQIQPLVEQASKDLQASADATKKQQIETNFEAAATKVVQAQGLTPERYRQLITLANTNPAFRSRVQKQLATLRASSPAPTKPGTPASPTPIPLTWPSPTP